MQPNHCDLLGQVREPRAASRMTRDGHQPLRDNGQPQQPGAAPMRSEDSWIDVSSQPSSSSFSSAATNEDIITIGLQVERGKRAHISAVIGDAVYNILLLSPQPRWTMHREMLAKPVAVKRNMRRAKASLTAFSAAQMKI